MFPNKFTNHYQIKDVYLNDRYFKKTISYLKKQNYIKFSKVKRMIGFFLKKNYPFCSILLFNKKIVGFLGTIISDKYSFNKKYLNCNIHSWIVDKKHRPLSSLLFQNIIKKKYTITALSPPLKLFETYKKLQFKKFIMIYNLILIKKFINIFLFKQNNFYLELNLKKIKQRLNKKDYQIYSDHQNLNFYRFLFCQKNKKTFCMIIANISHKKKYFKVLNIIYASNKKFLKKNINNFYKLISLKFNIIFCSEYLLKKRDSNLSNNNFFNVRKKITIYIKNKPLNFEFNNLYSELEY